MNRNALVVVAVCAGLIAGCSTDEPELAKTQVERRVATLVGDDKGGHAEAKCEALSEDRAYRCEVSVNGVASTYEARHKKNSEKIELKEG